MKDSTKALITGIFLTVGLGVYSTMAEDFIAGLMVMPSSVVFLWLFILMSMDEE